MIKNKKAAEKIISVYWFVILFLVAGAIVYMVSSFYGKPYDIRGIEAELLVDKAADCVSYGGYLREEVLTPEFKDNFLARCGITFEVEDAYGWRQEEQYFLQINFYDFNSYPNSDSLFEVSAGNFNLKDFCNIKSDTSPVCLEREVYALSKAGTPYTIKILSIIKKTEKNAQ
jgi:hypothetical protein